MAHGLLTWVSPLGANADDVVAALRGNAPDPARRTTLDCFSFSWPPARTGVR